MDERPGYARSDWVTQHVINPLVATLTRWGVSVVGSRILRVRGPHLGAWRETPTRREIDWLDDHDRQAHGFGKQWEPLDSDGAHGFRLCLLNA